MAGNSVCYATVEDLAMLAIPDNQLAKVDGKVAERHLEIASGRVNSYLKAQYTLPLKQDTVTGLYPPEIVEATAILAAYSLMQFIGYDPNGADIKYQQRYHDMVGNPNVIGSKGWLDRVSSGAVSLGLAVDATPATDEGAPKVDTQPCRGWNVDQLGNTDTRFI